MVAALRTMRIVAVPLTRPSARIQGLTNGKLSRYTYYLIQLPPMKQPSSLEHEKAGNGPSTLENRGWLPEEGVMNWATQKATDTWTGFGKAEGGWKLRTYQIGQKLVDRIEFEELALRNFDPSLALPPEQLGMAQPPTKFKLLYPPSVLSPMTALSDLRSFVELRIPRHRNGFFLWMSIIPVTAPFKLIPIIPNLPFFFSAWRSWSHYRANKSSKYLRYLLGHDLIEPQGSELLDQVYRPYRTSIPPHATVLSAPTDSKSSARDSNPHSLDFSTSSGPEDPLILRREAVPTLLSALDLPKDSIIATDLNRAIDQTRARISTKV